MTYRTNGQEKPESSCAAKHVLRKGSHSASWASSSSALKSRQYNGGWHFVATNSPYDTPSTEDEPNGQTNTRSHECTHPMKRDKQMPPLRLMTVRILTSLTRVLELAGGNKI